MNFVFLQQMTPHTKWLRGFISGLPPFRGASFTLIGAILLSGCITTSETFDCPAGKGVGCHSISQVDHMVNQGALDSSPEVPNLEKGAQPTTLPFPPPIMVTGPAEFKGLPEDVSTISGPAVIHRLPEEPLRVWVAPFQDGQGNFHEASVIHTVLKPGRWQFNAASHPAPIGPGVSVKDFEEGEAP